jgi:hypothetical protein
MLLYRYFVNNFKILKNLMQKNTENMPSPILFCFVLPKIDIKKKNRHFVINFTKINQKFKIIVIN